MNTGKGSLILQRLDIGLIVCVVGLMVLGVAFVYSSGVNSESQQMSGEWIKQIIWSVTGLVFMAGAAFIDYRRWQALAIPMYIGYLLVLVLVLFAGNYVKGARSWLGIGSFGIQPSEFGKIIVIIMLAWWFGEQGKGESDLRQSLGAIIIAMVPVGLILLQPDLGTAFVYIPILFTIAFFAGIGWRVLLFPLAVGVLIVSGVLGYAWNEHIADTPLNLFRLFTEMRLFRTVFLSSLGLIVMTAAGWFIFHRRYFLPILYGLGVFSMAFIGIAGAARVLRGYQMMRLVVFLNPQIDPRGAGWHIIQSVTAVGSGGIAGKGFLQGTQSHYRYLPEQSTDFIFSIIAEEIGFLGCLFVFALFAYIIIRALRIAYTSFDKFGSYIAVGVAAMISFHVIENIGMAIGVMPITGIPLFFLSYGGSSLWTALMAMGLLLSIHFRRSYKFA
ncbi:MAG: rod shape-determining protein RodA [Spirochaeta sp. LUC14_002_19_P3]|nr:MAG: rod shape-determining protein RodA [Spirochaeta sp. LUC14_002_19_P3]